WLCFLHPAEDEVDFLLDAAETGFSYVPASAIGAPRPPMKPEEVEEFYWRRDEKPQLWFEMAPLVVWCDAAVQHCEQRSEVWTKVQHVRLWQLLHWRDTPTPKESRQRPGLVLLAEAFEAGAASEADVIDYLLGARRG